ncbi:MAG: ArsR family transcriptional regulator [Pseudomonadota bacterium]
MQIDSEADALTALGHSGRLAVFRLLARRAPQGVRPSELAEALALKPNTLSVYVSTLSKAGLVSSVREGRSVFYRINIDRVSELTTYLIADCCRGRPELCAPIAAHSLQQLNLGAAPMADRPFSVLFICTGNSARSVFAEALLRSMGGARFVANSAGTRPYSELNPYAVDLLRQLGHDTSVLRAKHISEFQSPEAPKMDFVFTVCDSAANEECPPWPGQPISAHWGMEDPVKVDGTDAEKALAFRHAYNTVRTRLTGFVELPFSSLDGISLQSQLDQIGEMKADAAGAAR